MGTLGEVKSALRGCRQFVAVATLGVMGHLLVTTVTPDRDSAVKLAASAIAAKLAATAKVHGPVASFFWHLGESGEGEEWQAVFQTTDERFDDLEAHLIAGHPWNKPEVTAIELRGNADYLAWIDSATLPS